MSVPGGVAERRGVGARGSTLAGLRRIASRRWFEPALFLLAVALFFAYIFRDQLGTRPWSMQDFVAWPRTLGQAWEGFHYSWSEAGLGSFNPLNPGNWLARTLLGPAFASAGLAQRVFYLAQLPVSVVGMYLLLRYLVATPWVRVLVAVLYTVNGFIIPAFQLGAIPGLVVHTGFPWFMLLTLHFLRDQQHRTAPLLGAMVVLALVSLWQPFALVRLSPFFAAFFFPGARHAPGPRVRVAHERDGSRRGGPALSADDAVLARPVEERLERIPGRRRKLV